MSIQAFTIHKKMLDCLTNELHAEYSWAGSEGEKKESKVFASHMEGNRIIDQHARDWFLGSLEDYVNHKKQIIHHGQHTDQEASLNLCLMAYERFTKFTLQNITSQFIKGYEHFVKILPSENNSSFKSSVQNLHELKKFCETYNQHLHGKQS